MPIVPLPSSSCGGGGNMASSSFWLHRWCCRHHHLTMMVVTWCCHHFGPTGGAVIIVIILWWWWHNPGHIIVSLFWQWHSLGHVIVIRIASSNQVQRQQQRDEPVRENTYLVLDTLASRLKSYHSIVGVGSLVFQVIRIQLKYIQSIVCMSG